MDVGVADPGVVDLDRDVVRAHRAALDRGAAEAGVGGGRLEGGNGAHAVLLVRVGVLDGVVLDGADAAGGAHQASATSS